MSDNLKVAMECGAFVKYQLTSALGKVPAEVIFNVSELDDYTSRILASQQAAHEAEIARLKGELESERRICTEYIEQRNDALAACAMKDEVLRTFDGSFALDQWDETYPPSRGWDNKRINAISAPPQQVSEWERNRLEHATGTECDRWATRLNWVHEKYGVDGSGCDSGDPLDVIESEIKQALNKQEEQMEPLLAQVAMLVEVAKLAEKEPTGLLRAVASKALSNTQATAEQLIAECEQRGAVKALDMVIDICESEGDEPNEGMSDFADGYGAACNQIAEHVKLLSATSKKS